MSKDDKGKKNGNRLVIGLLEGLAIGALVAMVINLLLSGKPL